MPTIELKSGTPDLTSMSMCCIAESMSFSSVRTFLEAIRLG